MAYQDLPNQIKGMIGVYFMAQELSRNGLIAVPTIRNVGATDMLAANANGTRAVTLQVKTTDGDEFGVWSCETEPSTYDEGDSWLAEAISPAPTKLFALVQVDGDGVPKDYWIMPSKDVLEEVQRVREQYLGGRYRHKSEIRQNKRTGRPVKDRGNWAIEPHEKYKRGLGTVLRLLNPP